MSTTTDRSRKPVVLCILDGWGHRDETTDNAIALAETPTWDRLMASCPRALVETSGLDVGLPQGQMGNSEVGHMNIGAGRVVMQDLPRIDQAVADGSLADNAVLRAFIDSLKTTGGTAHLMGLLSPGGVHSHQDHMVALAKILSGAGVPVRIHAFLDGRDTPPQSGRGFVETFLKDIAGLPDVAVATVAGRFYGMDRDKRWDRVTAAHDAIVEAKGERHADALALVDASYAAGKTDEFVVPAVVGAYQGARDGDGLLFANFRADRAREITQALLDPAFDGFQRARVVRFAAAAGMTQYSVAHTAWLDALFPPEPLSGILGEVVSQAGRTQLRIAETEKYAHVTFFLNGGEETVYPGEERILVPSPKVATYDLQPEMSAPEVTEKLVAAIGGGTFDLIVANFANGDMVGHTGMLDAAMAAARTIDASLAAVEKAVLEAGGAMIVTADHGNCEMMRDPESGEPHTAHTVGKVDALLVGAPDGIAGLRDGRLADLAPTVLALMGLPQPSEMTGRSLLQTKEQAAAAE